MAKQLSLERHSSCESEKWDSFVERSNEGTIFHRLDFLSYHGQRFQGQEHHLVWFNGQELYGLMPMAILDESDGRTARSPYGGSYGGPIFERAQSYETCRSIVGSLLDYLVTIDASSCRLTLPLSCCYATYSETFRLVLLEHGFKSVNRDICSVICLERPHSVLGSSSAREKEIVRKARKAKESGVRIESRAEVSDFWHVAEKNFEKLNVSPTHTLEEFRWLSQHLPDKVSVDVAYLGDQPVAGLGLIVLNERVNSSFYICQDPEFRATQALSGLIYQSLINSQNSGFNWFDLGTSSAKMQGRENLFRFKESFGAIGLFRETYLWQG